MRPVRLASAASALVLLLACTGKQESPHPAFGSFGVDLAWIDPDVKPGDDFFRYVNGKWLDTFQIPADKSSYGAAMALVDQAEENVRTLVESLAAEHPAPGTTPQKVADLYSSWMDTDAVEARGLGPLRPYLDAVEAVSAKADLMRLFGNIDYTAPFGIAVYPDPADTTKYTAFIGQAGLGMPNRDYYLEPGERFDAYREAYRTYATRIFELLGNADPAAAAGRVIALETKIAESQWEPERQRDISQTYNPMDRAGLAALAPGIDWDVVLDGVGLGGVQTLVVAETTAIHDAGEVLDSEPLDTWKDYLTFHLADSNTMVLPRDFDQASFEFFDKTLDGVEQQQERWKRGVGLLNGLIGEGVGEVYVEHYFPPESKAKMDELVANLRAALQSRLETLPWMDDATRQEALTKLSTFEPRIGYPSNWRDYTALSIEPGKLFENVHHADAFEWHRQVSRLDQPVDRSEWAMNPQTVNAYYNPLMNQITFPAAILQPPIFDASADPAVNYGAIGAIIGHEIGHGFDDQGRKFDEKGKIRDWWTQETDAKFRTATERLAAQYDAYCPLPDACVNGRLTMGENIGDLGGLQMAYTAYHRSLEGQEAPVIEGLSGDQRFFLAWAQAYRSLTRDDALRNQLITNPHSPARYRANGAVRNVDAWYDAFDVQPGDALYVPPEERVRIW